MTAQATGAGHTAPHFDTDDLNDFEDFVAAGLPLLQKQSDGKWQLGDIAVKFDIALGRPSGDADSPQLGDLAAAWDTDTRRVSEWRKVASFYPPNVRTFPLSWNFYNLARLRADGEVDNALELLDSAIRLKLGFNAFRRYINGEYYEGPISVDLLPEHLHQLFPASEKIVWGTFRRYVKDD